MATRLADEATKLRNCAVWNYEMAERASDPVDRERYERQAFRLFMRAKALRESIPQAA